MFIVLTEYYGDSDSASILGGYSSLEKARQAAAAWTRREEYDDVGHPITSIYHVTVDGDSPTLVEG